MALTAEENSRYRRQILLKEVGEAGQETLLASHVLVVGAGGLGSPVAAYLAAAGVGHLGIIDGDTVDPSNLNRQILYGDGDVGRIKVEKARERLLAINSTITITPYHQLLTAENAETICRDYQVIVDCLDNFAARFILNDVCLKLGLPLVHAGVYKYFGQTLTIMPGVGPCLRCIYPQGDDLDKIAPSCGEDGVLGVVPGILGTLQAMETLKILLSLGQVNSGQILYFDGLNLNFEQIKVQPRPDCVCRHQD